MNDSRGQGGRGHPAAVGGAEHTPRRRHERLEAREGLERSGRVGAVTGVEPAVEDDAFRPGGAHAHDHLLEIGRVVAAVAQADALGLVVVALAVEGRGVEAAVLGPDAEAAHEREGGAGRSVLEERQRCAGGWVPVVGGGVEGTAEAATVQASAHSGVRERRRGESKQFVTHVSMARPWETRAVPVQRLDAGGKDRARVRLAASHRRSDRLACVLGFLAACS